MLRIKLFSCFILCSLLQSVGAHINLDDNGNALATWQGKDGIYASTKSTNKKWTTPIRIAEMKEWEVQYFAKPSLLSNGIAILSWEHVNNECYTITGTNLFI